VEKEEQRISVFAFWFLIYCTAQS